MRIQKLARVMMYAGLVIVLLICGAMGVQTYRAKALEPESQRQLLAAYGLDQAPAKRLSSQFTDSDRDLLADAPADPARLIDPPSLKIAFVKSSENRESVDWDKLGQLIEAETGKPATISGFVSLRDALEDVRSNILHVLIVHAPETPYLANQFGFIPFAVATDDEGPNGHRLFFIVRPGSTIQTPADLKSRELLCTEPLSVVGYRTAIANLQQTWNLRPGVDFNLTFSGGQDDSILAIANGRSEVAAVSSTKLQSMTRDGEVRADQYRIVYQSEVIPRYTVGYFHNLKPEVAAKIRQAVLTFQNSPDPTDDDRPARFVSINYTKDFATVRAIDDTFDPRLTSPMKEQTIEETSD